jgi:hypothetical protein
MPLNDAQTGRFLYVPLAQETEQFSSKESVVGANPTRDAWSFYSIYILIEGKSLLYPYEVYHTFPIKCRKCKPSRWSSILWLDEGKGDSVGT